jgi:hypothetical protein
MLPLAIEFRNGASSASVEDWGPTIVQTVTSLVGPIENHPIPSALLLISFPSSQNRHVYKGIVKKEVFERP